MYDFETYWFVYLVAAIINGVIWGMVCKYIISIKGYDEEKQRSYFWVGFFLGIIGAIVAAVTPQNTYSSPTGALSNTSAQRDGVWKCNGCGKTNYGYASYSKCSCGLTRKESEEAANSSITNNVSPITNGSQKTASQPRRNYWICSYCGNKNYVISPLAKCTCGKTKKESEQNKIDKANENKQPQNNNDVLTDLDALKKLKELLDMGAITQEEFDEKKAKLLK